MTVRTDIEWTYAPVDLFEAPLTLGLSDGNLLVDGGKATYMLKDPHDDVPLDLHRRIDDQVARVFQVRQLQTRRLYTLSASGVVQHRPDGGRMFLLSTVAASGVVCGGDGSADFQIVNAAGEVTFDSKQQPIADQTAMLVDLVPKAVGSSTLRTMLNSYSRAIEDPSDELVHLYEIRDAAKAHFGNNEVRAQNALGITEPDWGKLGRIANDKHIAECRHRGQQSNGTRPASAEELTTARQIARSILENFAATL